MTYRKSPSFKTLALLALGLLALAFSHPATAANITWSSATGAPTIPTGKTNAVYIWHVGGTVYVTTTGDQKAGHKFSGTITVTGAKGKISGLTGKKLEKQDSITLKSSTQVQFLFITHQGKDALHFKLTGGTQLSLLATYDLATSSALIHYGKSATPAGKDPAVFDLTK